MSRADQPDDPLARVEDDATAILARVRTGDERAADRLLPLVYDQLRRLARRLLRAEPPGISLQPTALVHEAYLRLIDQRKTDWKDRAHFMAVATTVMRRVLVDRARRRRADKRGGGQDRVELVEGLVGHSPEVGVLELDLVLSRLAEVSPRRAHVAALRVFGGLGIRDIVQVMDGTSERTVERDWAAARAWLKVELARG